MRKFTKVEIQKLQAVRPILERQLERIAKEKETGHDHRHIDGDCGFELLAELEEK